MSLQKKPYEISIWEDIVIYVGTDGNEYNSPSNMPEGVTTSYQYYSEQQLAVIGSSTMTSPARTRNNVLKRNINGVETLTFEMYYQYEDIEFGGIVHNPLIDLIIDERKVKLHYNNKWYDFIVKKDDEKGRDYKYSFTCTGLAANELGKTGFRVELDTELENNMGTIQQLGSAVLEGSDWSMGEMDESIKQTNDESLYLIKLNTNITGTIRGTSTTKSIASGNYIYVYYTTYINQVEDYFQFIYVDSNNGSGTPNLYDDKITINCNNVSGGTYDLYLNNVSWVDGEPSFRDLTEPKNIVDYRGRRYVRKQLMGYDAILKRPIYKYKGAPGHQAQGVVANRAYYGYTTTEYCDATSVTNYIYNSINFLNTSYWYSFGNGASLDARVYPDVDYADSYNIVHNSYLLLNFGQTLASGRVVNEGISKNYSRINRFEKGEKYRFKVLVGQENNGAIVQNSTLPFKCIVKKYTSIDADSEDDKIYFTFDGNGSIVYGKIVLADETVWEANTYYIFQNNNYILSTEYVEGATYYLPYLCVDAVCENSATWEELKANTGIFLYPRASSNLNKNYYIRDIQFYRYIENENGDVMDINDVPEVRVITHYHFYDPDVNAAFLTEDDYIYNNNNKDYYLPLYGSGENEFEKVRSITAKESNRFNLLQELCETFECWVRFDIAHEANGQISLETYDYYSPISIKGGCGLNGTLGLERGNIGSSGQDIGQEGYYVRHDYVEVTPNQSYTLTSNSNVPIIKLYWYNENKQFITSIEKTQDNIYVSPINAYYVRFTLSKSTVGHFVPTEPSMITELNLYPNGVYYYNKTENSYQLLTSYRATDVFYTPVVRKRQSKKVVFYEEILQDNYVGFKYGINLKDNNRVLDSEQIVTKIIVKDNTCEQAKNGFCTIARAQDNPLKENFALNLDYYVTQGLINKQNLDNDLYLEQAGSIGLYPRLSKLNNGYTQNGITFKGKNELIEEQAKRLNSITELSALYQAATLTYDEATKELSKILDPVSGTIVKYTGYQYEDFSNQCFRPTDINGFIPAYKNEVYYIGASLTALPIADSGTITYYIDKPASEVAPVSGVNYFTLENNHFKAYTNTKFSSAQNYYKQVNAQFTAGTYFQTGANTTKLKITGNSSSKVYIYAAARRVIQLDGEDFINDNYTIQKLIEVVTLKGKKAKAEDDKNVYGKDLETVQADYDADKNRLEDIAKATEEIEREFNTKYSRYIQEGSWSDDNYMDDDLYYLDSLNVLYQSAYPKVTYNFKVLELSQLEGYEAFTFDIAHKTFVEDIEFFGYQYVNGIKTPVKETVVVTEVTSNLDEPDKNDLKIQNYKSHFQDLFQRITAATQNLEYHSGEYYRAAQVITPEGTVNEETLQSSFDGASYIIQNSRDQSVVWNDTGIVVTNINDPAQVTRLASGGLMVSADGGQTWGIAITGYGINADYVKAGTIDADIVNIMSGSFPTFRWDANGLRAYRFESENNIIRSYDPSTYVTHDRFGVYGISGYIVPPELNTVEDVEDKANFALTWNGLFMRSAHRDGYVRVSPTEDIALYSTLNNTNILRGKFGLLGESGGNEIYGLALYNQNGQATVETKSNGTLWLKSQMDIGTDGTNQIYLGVGTEETQEHGYKVFKVYGNRSVTPEGEDEDNSDRFIVYEDGTLKARGVNIEGEINALSGKIGPVLISEVPTAIGVKINQNKGDTFKLDEEGDVTPQSLDFTYVCSLEEIDTVLWQYGSTSSSLQNVPSNWISTTTKINDTVVLNYSDVSSTFSGGLMYLKCTINSIYSSQLTIKLSKDGKSADAYTYDIESSLGYVINISNVQGNTTTLRARAYKNGQEISYTGLGIKWYKKDNNDEDFAEIIEARNQFTFQLSILNWASIQLYFELEEV